MTFNKRLKILERNAPTSYYIPPIIIHTIVEPSENGPREVGAYANIPIGKGFQKFNRKASESSKQFKRRVHCIIGINIYVLNMLRISSETRKYY